MAETHFLKPDTPGLTSWRRVPSLRGEEVLVKQIINVLEFEERKRRGGYLKRHLEMLAILADINGYCSRRGLLEGINIISEPPKEEKRAGY